MLEQAASMPAQFTDDTTLEDEYEITRLNAMSPTLRQLAALHAVDQFESVPSYVERFRKYPDTTSTQSYV